MGPDVTGSCGGMHGVGALEATVLETDGTTVPVLNDFAGNVLATISATNTTWNPIRVGVYGPVMGYRPNTPEPGTELAESVVWRSRWMDPSGFYCLGARYYDPMAGHFLSPDPLGHSASMDLYSMCAGDPLNQFDPTGCFGKAWGSDDMNNNLAGPSDSPASSLMDDFKEAWGLPTGVAGEIQGEQMAASLVNKATFGLADQISGVIGGQDLLGNYMDRGDAAQQLMENLVEIGGGFALASVGLWGSEATLAAGSFAQYETAAAASVQGATQLEFPFANADLSGRLSTVEGQVPMQPELGLSPAAQAETQLEFNLASGSAANTGLFRVGEAGTQGLPQTMETVLQHAEQGGIGLDGINVKIIPDAPPNFYGWANPNGTEIHLYPAAFTDSESLITTLGHERMHAYQFQTFGPAVNASTTSAQLFENGAVQTEGSFYQYFLSHGGGH